MRGLRNVHCRLFRGQAGLSLIEVIIALGLLGVLGVGMLVAITTDTRAARTLDEQVVAANLATDYFEAIRQSTYADIYPNVAENITRPSQYDVVVDIAFSANGIDWVATNTGNLTLQKIVVLVSREGRPVLTICTYKTVK